MNETLRLKISLALNFFVFSILLNTVGIVIAQVIVDYGTNRAGHIVLQDHGDLISYKNIRIRKL